MSKKRKHAPGSQRPSRERPLQQLIALHHIAVHLLQGEEAEGWSDAWYAEAEETARAFFPELPPRAWAAFSQVRRLMEGIQELGPGDWTPSVLRGPGSLSELTGLDPEVFERLIERAEQIGWIESRREQGVTGVRVTGGPLMREVAAERQRAWVTEVLPAIVRSALMDLHGLSEDAARAEMDRRGHRLRENNLHCFWCEEEEEHAVLVHDHDRTGHSGERRSRLLVYGICAACFEAVQAGDIAPEAGRAMLEPYRTELGGPEPGAERGLSAHRRAVRFLQETGEIAGEGGGAPRGWETFAAVQIVVRQVALHLGDDEWSPVLLRGPGSLAEVSGEDFAGLLAEARGRGWIEARELIPRLLWETRMERETLRRGAVGGIRA